MYNTSRARRDSATYMKMNLNDVNTIVVNQRYTRYRYRGTVQKEQGNYFEIW